MAVTTPEITELGKDIKYNVAVYDTNGNFVNEKHSPISKTTIMASILTEAKIITL